MTDPMKKKEIAKGGLDLSEFVENPEEDVFSLKFKKCGVVLLV